MKLTEWDPRGGAGEREGQRQVREEDREPTVEHPLGGTRWTPSCVSLACIPERPLNSLAFAAEAVPAS